MMLVKARISPSAIEGLGCFACEAIKPGTPVWSFSEQIDTVVYKAKSELSKLTKSHGIEYRDCYVLAGDAALFLNHSPAPNVKHCENDEPFGVFVCCAEIAAGEEMVFDYGPDDAAFDTPQPVDPNVAA
jgi:SET domain-containing protein